MRYGERAATCAELSTGHLALYPGRRKFRHRHGRIVAAIEKRFAHPSNSLDPARSMRSGEISRYFLI